MADKTPRKGKKFWTIRMDRKGRYEVAPALFQQRDEQFKGGSDFYKIAFEYEGKPETTVVDIDPSNIFTTEREAILECVRRCRDIAASWQCRADELMERLTK
jgi:hypothetical protein